MTVESKPQRQRHKNQDARPTTAPAHCQTDPYESEYAHCFRWMESLQDSPMDYFQHKEEMVWDLAPEMKHKRRYPLSAALTNPFRYIGDPVRTPRGKANMMSAKEDKELQQDDTPRRPHDGGRRAERHHRSRKGRSHERREDSRRGRRHEVRRERRHKEGTEEKVCRDMKDHEKKRERALSGSSNSSSNTLVEEETPVPVLEKKRGTSVPRPHPSKEPRRRRHENKEPPINGYLAQEPIRMRPPPEKPMRNGLPREEPIRIRSQQPMRENAWAEEAMRNRPWTEEGSSRPWAPSARLTEYQMSFLPWAAHRPRSTLPMRLATQESHDSMRAMLGYGETLVTGRSMLTPRVRGTTRMLRDCPLEGKITEMPPVPRLELSDRTPSTQRPCPSSDHDVIPNSSNEKRGESAFKSTEYTTKFTPRHWKPSEEPLRPLSPNPPPRCQTEPAVVSSEWLSEMSRLRGLASDFRNRGQSTRIWWVVDGADTYPNLPTTSPRQAPTADVPQLCDKQMTYSTTPITTPETPREKVTYAPLTSKPKRMHQTAPPSRSTASRPKQQWSQSTSLGKTRMSSFVFGGGIVTAQSEHRTEDTTLLLESARSGVSEASEVLERARQHQEENWGHEKRD